MIRSAIWGILAIYAVYAAIYFYGLDGENDYFWVNNDFFVYPLWGLILVIAIAVLVSQASRQDQIEQEGVRRFTKSIIAFALFVGFVPYAYLLALIAYTTQ